MTDLDILENILNDVGEAVVCVDKDFVAVYCNDNYVASTGLSRDRIVGKTPFEYIPGFRRSIFFNAIMSGHLERKPTSHIGVSKSLGRWLMIRVFPMSNGGSVMIANDASASVVKQFQLAQQATRDPLTGIGNKLALEQRIEDLLKLESKFAVVVIGLEHFKAVNDAHGYAFGDRVLMDVASTFQSTSVAGETLYRFSGDEFAVVMEAAGKNDVDQRSKVLISALIQPVAIGGVRVVLDARAGTVCMPEDGNSFESIAQRAGLALRESKSLDRYSVCSYEPQMETTSTMRAMLEQELRSALTENQFRLVFQPKVSLETGGVVGCEALVRWMHPLRGLLAPVAFLHVLQELGLMPCLDLWVITSALRFESKLMMAGLSIPISINLSVESLGDVRLVPRVESLLLESGVPSNLFEIEIPEGALMKDVTISSSVLSELKSIGVKVSIDDFGTGYSSFAYLAQFPVHTMKIDRSFVIDIESSPVGQTIVSTMIKLAHALSLDVVAEGVETDAQVNILREMKCDSVQGYVFAKPLLASDFINFATSANPSSYPNALTI